MKKNDQTVESVETLKHTYSKKWLSRTIHLQLVGINMMSILETNLDDYDDSVGLRASNADLQAFLENGCTKMRKR